MSTTKVLSTMFTAAVLPFINTSTGGNGGQVKENPKPALVKKTDEPKVAKVSQTVLPKLFQLHDFNGNGRIDVPEEALEFHSDKAHYNSAVFYTCDNRPYKKTKNEVNKVADWFIKVGNLKDTSSEEKEVFLDTAARLYQYMQGKDSILTPLPRIFAQFDEDKNGSIDAAEALKFYEARTKIKLERDTEGQVTPKDFRKVIDAFTAEDCPYSLKARGVEKTLNIPTSSAQYLCGLISNRLQEQYSKLYGPYSPFPDSGPAKLINRD